MNYLSVGDMAQTYQLRRHSTQIKKMMTTLTEETTTGIKSDLGKAVNGDFRALTSIDSSLTRLKSYSQSSNLASIFTSSTQAVLEAIQNKVRSSSSALLTASSNIASASIDTATETASQNFEFYHLSSQYKNLRSLSLFRNSGDDAACRIWRHDPVGAFRCRKWKDDCRRYCFGC
ncbi:hypothetical protein [Paenirhodobacter sp.]|uniref:hypothetical protein n=1 Tax=Paenirhodobacter sp. TaxID=1965326 RepID=UPI003B3C1F0D